MAGKEVAAEQSFGEAVPYARAVKDAFHGEPAKYKDFVQLICDLHARRVDQVSFHARVGELFKDHPNLLAGLNTFVPAEAMIFIPPEPEQPTELPDDIVKKHKDAHHLIKMIKKRFQSCDNHVHKSFAKILSEYKEGKKSGEEVTNEVVDLLYYHEDLVGEFLRFIQ